MSIGNKYGDFFFQAGVRVEYINMVIELVVIEQVNLWEYFNLFFSVFLGYDLGEIGNFMQVSYSCCINWLNFWSLNLFFSFSDVWNIFIGNFNFDFEFIDFYEINYLKYWDNVLMIVGVFYCFIIGKMECIQWVNFEGIIFIQLENLAIEDVYGVDVIFFVFFIKWWDLDGNVNFFWFIIFGIIELGEDFGVDVIIFFGWLILQIMFWDEFNMQIWFNYCVLCNDLQGCDKFMYYMDLILSKDILEKKGILIFFVSDVFNFCCWCYVNEGIGFYSEGDFQWCVCQACLIFFYCINQQKKCWGNYGGGYDGGGGDF